MEIYYKILETPEYRLAVSDEPIKEGKTFVTKDGIVHKNFGYNYGDKVVIGYSRKSEDSPELDLPLLYDIGHKEDNVDKLIDDFIHEYQQEGMLPSIAKRKIYSIISAATNLFPEEDLRLAIDKGYEFAKMSLYKSNNTLQPEAEKFIQSLKDSKCPAYFVAENRYGNCLLERCLNHLCDDSCKEPIIFTKDNKTYIRGYYTNPH
jgi:hypothetical protein